MGALDARAARGFRRDADSDRERAPSQERRRGRAARLRGLALPLGAGIAALLAVAVVAVVSSSRSGGGHVAQPALPSTVSGRASSGAAKAAPQSAPAAAEPASPAGVPRQVERSSALDLGVAADSVQSVSQRVFSLASSYGGYVAQSNVSSGAPAQAGASFDIRLPASKLASAITALSHLGRVRSENDATHDVTDQLGSLRRSLAGLEAERASLLRQLAAATEAGLVQTLKGRLHAVEASISGLHGAIRALQARVDYTTLSLTLTPESSGGASSGELTPGAAAGDAARILDAALAVLVIGGAAVLPLAAIVFMGWIVLALARRRLREHALDAG
jgi:hypothetical protein